MHRPAIALLFAASAIVFVAPAPADAKSKSTQHARHHARIVHSPARLLFVARQAERAVALQCVLVIGVEPAFLDETEALDQPPAVRDRDLVGRERLRGVCLKWISDHALVDVP